MRKRKIFNKSQNNIYNNKIFITTNIYNNVIFSTTFQTQLFEFETTSQTGRAKLDEILAPTGESSKAVMLNKT